VEARPTERPQRAGPDPWVRRALAAGVVIALAGNGLTTVIEGAYQDARAAAEDRVAARDMKPEEVADASPAGPPASRARTAYRVEASLDGDELEWETTIAYVNATGEPLADIGVNVFANAYTRALPEIPFGRDLLASDFNGEFQALARPGETTRFEVTVDGRDVPATLRDTGVTIDLDRDLVPGGRVEIGISIAMELPLFPERFGRWDDLTLLGNWIPVVAQREAGAWRLEAFGSIGDPFVSEIADYDVVLAVDENVSVVGTGSLVEVREAPGELREWHFDAPAVRDAAFVAGPFLRGLEARAAGTTVRSWYSAGEGARGAANLEAAASSVADYVERYGELPWPEVDVVETEGRLGGMEYPGVVFVSSASEAFAGLPLLPDLVSYSGFEEARSRYVVGHELAHQWWYASVGNDQIREPWLDEALAEASTRLWLGESDDGERTALMTNLVVDADASPDAVRAGIVDFGSNEAYTETVYVEGSEVLLELRRTVGAEAYDGILRAWHESRSLEIGTIDEFARTVARVAGESAGPFLERYF
ncbi:MAG: M1 family metallopeptidase, partial [Actinomycetota bacterium]|nr:M1 family metallopeptidase [Actinomycetota bacterium]